MEKYILKNDFLTVTINEHGAELASVVRDGKEYMWYADPKFWGRTAPVLFPIVGMLEGKKYRHEGKTYDMGQHGLARDLDFICKSINDREAWFELRDNEETFLKYPFHFVLEIGYILKEDNIQIIWKVTNPDDKDLIFSIGGHPAFLCPFDENHIYDGSKDYKCGYKIRFAKNGKPLKEFTSKLLQGSYVGPDEMKVPCDDGTITLDEHTFDIDTFIIEDKQVDEVSLLTKEGKEYLTVKFDCPLAGIWSPPDKKAPFVCIEPWYGRCDRVGYAGDFKDREYTNTLKPGENFTGGFTVAFN